ncbi:hypothetical protein L596_002503 [Steinernema carpocapsae]|uniref:Secreted protein n=1 Tax=Steinernema carpocapsae TaxID=34508 RepID=A0A4U8UPY9_STECR|nr:hypothetical protein L596_002503 [Steinernema carpocapsae]
MSVCQHRSLLCIILLSSVTLLPLQTRPSTTHVLGNAVACSCFRSEWVVVGQLPRAAIFVQTAGRDEILPLSTLTTGRWAAYRARRRPRALPSLNNASGHRRLGRRPYKFSDTESAISSHHRSHILAPVSCCEEEQSSSVPDSRSPPIPLSLSRSPDRLPYPPIQS